jgi:C-terminal processing protease CtpA/Prc
MLVITLQAGEPTPERVKQVRAMYEKLPCNLLDFAEPVKKAESLADTNGEVIRLTLLDAKNRDFTIELHNETGVISISKRRASIGVVVGNRKGGDGVLVGEVTPGSPAASSGLRAGDVMTKVNGQSTKTMEEFRKLLADKKPDDKLDLAFQRNGKEQVVTLTLGLGGGGPFDPLIRLPSRGPEESAVYGLLLRLPKDHEKHGVAELLKILDKRFAGAIPGGK